MSGRSITVSIDPANHVAWVQGWRAYWLIELCGGRPLWSRRRKAWNTSEHVARDVLAFADLHGIDNSYAVTGVTR